MSILTITLKIEGNRIIKFVYHMDLLDKELMQRVINLESELKDTYEELSSILKQSVPSEEEMNSVFNFIKKIHEVGLISRAESYIQRRFNVSYEKAEGYLIQFIENYPNGFSLKKKSIQNKAPSKTLQIWNSFLKVVRSELEKNGMKVTYDEVVKKAREMKDSDQDSYKLFADNWTPEN